MSQLLKALNKVRKEQAQNQEQQSPPADGLGTKTSPSQAKTTPSLQLNNLMYFILACMFVLSVFTAIGLYLNYSVSQKIALTQNRLATISDGFSSQQQGFNKLNEFINQSEITNAAQRKEFFAKLDQLSASIDQQLKDSNAQSQAHYRELTKTIDEQQKSIQALNQKYDQLNDRLTTYKSSTDQYEEQINALKKKLVELNLSQ